VHAREENVEMRDGVMDGSAPALTGARWRKATASNATGSCVELARVGDMVALRNSRRPLGLVLAWDAAAVAGFVAAAAAGEFDELLES
jgi:Domain of unknown function (DUF397)